MNVTENVDKNYFIFFFGGKNDIELLFSLFPPRTGEREREREREGERERQVNKSLRPA